MYTEEREPEPNVAVTMEQPSPVSVLQAAYRDESPSPVQKISKTFKGKDLTNFSRNKPNKNTRK